VFNYIHSYGEASHKKPFYIFLNMLCILSSICFSLVCTFCKNGVWLLHPFNGPCYYATDDSAQYWLSVKSYLCQLVSCYLVFNSTRNHDKPTHTKVIS